MNIFEEASKCKLRIDTDIGGLDTERLWDLNLGQLNQIYEDLSSQKKDLKVDSLLKDKTPEDKLLKLKLDIVEHIFKVKEKVIEKQESEMLKRERNKQIDEIIHRKENAELEDKSIEELKKLKEE